MREHRFSRATYRLLLRTYPREFRERFARDLDSDFLEMARSRGAASAWRRALSDLFRAVPLTVSDAAAERARTAIVVPARGTKVKKVTVTINDGQRSRPTRSAQDSATCPPAAWCNR